MAVHTSLTVADWHRLNQLLERGLEFEGAERTAWLEKLGDEDQHLRAVLIDLLSQSDATGFAEATHPPTAVANVAAQALAAMRREQPGDRIGPWQLTRLLAEGGMGAVWVAERADGVMKRTAALKLPRAEWIDHGLSERIARERAILARLQHPHIAVLYDAGLGAEGRPYLALEYVDGVPIDVYCKTRDLRSVLQLFVQVIRAVAYAHGQLVIHRDLKPANVLVTPDGTPKLLDFGISKLIEGDSTSVDATALTRLAGRPLTLAYAAPEQVLSLPITVAADVYALGVMLFELLTGSRLYRAQEPRALEAELLRGDLRRPSDVASNKQRAKALHGDLDAIIGMALKRAPEARYQSAAALADDLQRYLDGQPVAAQPDSRSYRLRKFISRNTLPVTAGSAVVVALVIGAGVALWQANVAREQATRATALNTFVLSLIRTADPNASVQTKAADVAMLNAIEERIDKEFNGSPDQLQQLRVTVGDAYRNRGEVQAARRVFQRAVDEAAPHIAADDLLLLTARVRASDTRLIVSTAASEQLDRAIAILRNKSQRDTAAAELLLDALLNRNELQFNFGVPAHALPERRFDIIQEANELALRHFGEGSRQHLRVVPAYAEMASVMKPDAGPPIIESALQRARQRGDEATGSVEYLMVNALHAVLLCESGRLGEGGALLREAVEHVRGAHGPTSVQLESLLMQTPACDEAALRWAAADAFEIAAARERPPSTQLMRRAMEAFNSALAFRDWASAERYYRSALENVEAIPEPALRDRLTIGLRSRRILQLAQRGDTDEAVQLAMPLKAEFDAEYLRIGRITPVQAGGFWAALSHAQRLGGRAADAEQTAQTFLDRCLVTMKTGPGGVCDQRALAVLALARLDLGRIAEAQAAVEQRLARSQRFADDANFALAYGRVLLATHRTAEATEVLRQHYGTWLSMHPSSPYTAEALYWFGRAYQAAGDKRGDWMVPQAREALAKSPIASHRALARAP